MAQRVYALSFATEGTPYSARAWAYVGYDAVPIPTVAAEGAGGTRAALPRRRTDAAVDVVSAGADVRAKRADY